MSNLKEYLKGKADELLTMTRNWWSPQRLAEGYTPGAKLQGFRLARSGKHRNTMLSKHEQTRNPAGTKLWKCRWAWGRA